MHFKVKCAILLHMGEQLFTLKDILRIYEAGPDAVVQFVMQLNELLLTATTTIAQLQLRIEALESQLSKDSHNSHKPPSSDGLKRMTKSLRAKSTRFSGGQEGHPGHTLSMVKNPNEIIVHRVKQCQGCNGSLEETIATDYVQRQVFDIPPLRLKVTEHHAEIKQCPHCGASNQALFPQEVTKNTQYGDNVKSLAVYLTQYQLLPYERTTELLNDLFSCSITEGSLYNWNKKAYQTLKKPEQLIINQLQQASVLNVDETGVFCQNKSQWLHVASTSRLTHYGIHAKRGKEATDALGILPHYKGTAVHDFWKSYLQYDCGHAFCNAHIMRELTYAFEQENQPWANELKALLLTSNEQVGQHKHFKNSLSENNLHEIERQYDALLEIGFRMNPNPPIQDLPKKRGRPKQSKVKNLLDRLQDYRSQVLAFMYDFQIPFTNNLAERDLRMAKVKQKISGTFRSPEGALFFCRIRGYISTMKKNHQKVLDTLISAFSGNPFLPQMNYA